MINPVTFDEQTVAVMKLRENVRKHDQLNEGRDNDGVGIEQQPQAARARHEPVEALQARQGERRRRPVGDGFSQTLILSYRNEVRISS